MSDTYTRVWSNPVTFTLCDISLHQPWLDCGAPHRIPRTAGGSGRSEKPRAMATAAAPVSTCGPNAPRVLRRLWRCDLKIPAERAEGIRGALSRRAPAGARLRQGRVARIGLLSATALAGALFLASPAQARLNPSAHDPGGQVSAPGQSPGVDR